MDASRESGSRFRTLLLLGRVSNLPTVWSNCLAGWLFTGEPLHLSFGWVLGGATCLYTGGMFLNDACDATFDRERRAERPIPRGLISRRAVWMLASLLLAVGMGFLVVMGGMAAVCTLALVAAIVAYNGIHKRWVPSLALMALCRSLLYLIAAAAAVGNLKAAAVPAVGLGLYVLGISFIARRESGQSAVPLWPLGLLLAPMALALGDSPTPSLAATGIGCMVLLSWLSWAVLDSRRGLQSAARLVGRLIAGIVLVDMLFVAAASGPGWSFLVLAVFLVLALFLQKHVPAS